MNIKLFFQAIIKYVFGVLIVGALLFIPANSFEYWNGWLFMGLLFIPMFIAGIILMIKNPELLKKRLNAKDKENEQKWVLFFSGLMFLSGFIIAGLNYRYKWIEISNIVIIISSILFIIEYILYAEVLRENTFLSRTIEVQENQKVIDTGLYGIVRHPMYAITILLFLTMPLILGSFISFLIFLIYPIVSAKRIKNEEEVLEKDLKDYADYKKKVKYKIIPFVW
ncbi:MAG: isoprenylcysteine carboxylmethyltransferase family protein [Romboutsia sp.]|nr:isoprenylcysteine carboxylmethyltransferase family protein [Romboutsia sp.]